MGSHLPVFQGHQNMNSMNRVQHFQQQRMESSLNVERDEDEEYEMIGLTNMDQIKTPNTSQRMENNTQFQSFQSAAAAEHLN